MNRCHRTKHSKTRGYYLALFLFALASLATPVKSAATCPIINGCQIQAVYPCALSGGFCAPCYTDACIYKCGSTYYYSTGACCTCA